MSSVLSRLSEARGPAAIRGGGRSNAGGEAAAAAAASRAAAAAASAGHLLRYSIDFTCFTFV